MSDPVKPLHSVSVRDLVEFVLRTGDLAGEGEFVGAGRALEGTRGHQRVQRSRPSGYQTEVVLSCRLERERFTLQIKGRVDGIFQAAEEIWLEEIKTVRRSWDGLADPLHWAQGKVYAAIYAQQNTLEQLEVRLTYLELDSNQVTEFRETFTRAELAAFFEATTASYLEWLEAHVQWIQERDAALRSLPFPFAAYRPGQRNLSVAVYRTVERGWKLFVEAPTGIGKTVSVLFPTLKAMAEGKTSRIFYLTAKTIGRTVAEQALADLRRSGARVRSVTLTAKEKICFNNGQPCDPRVCPFALGYYDRNKAAIRHALQREALTRPVLEEIAREHQVCPFELSLDVSLWVDVIIGDYNYAFDPRVYLRRHFGEETNDFALLVDEAHNLVERAREMFSAELDKSEVLAVKRALRRELPVVVKTLNKLNTFLLRLRPDDDSVDDGAGEDDPLELDYGGRKSSRPAANQLHVQREIPEGLLPLLRDFLQAAELWLAQNRAADYREALQNLYFQVNRLVRTAGLYDECYVTLLEVEPQRTRLRLFCLDPAKLLHEALARSHAAVLFSATLSPMPYFREILGGEAVDKTLQLASPFPAENLCLLVQDRIATHFKARASTFAVVAETIAAFVRGRVGNYLVYFPSYSYLKEVEALFRELAVDLEMVVQTPGMKEVEREVFLSAFQEARIHTLVGFAVMGGIFGEGIDLVGERLVGAVIVGVGLPQLSTERDLIRDYFQAKHGDGFEYAYTFPGMNRVLQAVGRVIRSETDRGAVLLIDARFSESRYQKLFPAWWQPVRTRSLVQLTQELTRFWPVLPVADVPSIDAGG